MSRTLRQISKSPLIQRIEGGKLSRRFTQPAFTMYNGRMDPVEHVSHFNQRMAVHSKNEALMCKVFPSSLGLVTMRCLMGWRKDQLAHFKSLLGLLGLDLLLVVGFLIPWIPCCLWPCERERP